MKKRNREKPQQKTKTKTDRRIGEKTARKKKKK